MKIEKAIVELKSYMPKDNGMNNPDIKAFDLAILALEKQLNNSWIPVNERLPNKTGWYVTTMEGYNYSKWTDRKYFNVKKKIFTGTKMKVLAWKEQAQPYTEVAK